MPFDSRVWKEAILQGWYRVTVLCPAERRSKNYESSATFAFIDIHAAKNTPLAMCGSMRGLIFRIPVCARIFLRHGFHNSGCNPPDDIFLVALPFKRFGVKYILTITMQTELYLARYEKKIPFTRFRSGLKSLAIVSPTWLWPPMQATKTSPLLEVASQLRTYSLYAMDQTWKPSNPFRQLPH